MTFISHPDPRQERDERQCEAERYAERLARFGEGPGDSPRFTYLITRDYRLVWIDGLTGAEREFELSEQGFAEGRAWRESIEAAEREKHAA